MLVTAGCAAGVGSFCASQEAPARFDTKAVWTPDKKLLSDIREKCGRGDPPKLKECFVAEMQAAGASADALAFAKTFPDAETGYMWAFRQAGAIGIAFIEYGFRANDFEGIWLINGAPPRIDVDEYKLFTEDMLDGIPEYDRLRRQYPKITLWPGDRFNSSISVSKTDSGGENIVIGYTLRDGCHACADLGTAHATFQFDASGKFLGAKPQDVQPGGTRMVAPQD